MSRILAPLLAAALVGCASASRPPPRAGLASASPGVDIVAARALSRTQGFEWLPYDAKSFAKAKAERRYILLDGAAEWCHWCHVMDETTYRDPEIGRLLREKFVAIRIDVDARPDLEERYGEWGWPATILLSPDAEELGKFRGYLEPERLRAALGSITTAAPVGGAPPPALADKPATVEALPWIAARASLDLDGWYDAKQGGWGAMQKAPLGANVEFEVLRAQHGDAAARARVGFTLDHQRALIDPVWGGVYQYSAGTDWTAPHFEKLMTVQAAALEASARAFALTGEPKMLADARAVEHYLTTFLSAPDGRFYTNQDADVGAHDPGGAFVDGHVFYAKDDAGRRALGMPWIDRHVYGRENGLAIAALCTLQEVTHDAALLARVRTSLDALLASHVLADGTVLHDPDKRDGPYFLADSAAVARALGRVAEVTHDAKYVAEARKVAARLLERFEEPSTGALLPVTVDANAAGVFGRREPSLPNVVVAARALCALGRATAEPSWKERARKLLAEAASPKSVDAPGRDLGELLVALDEAGAVSW
ncbi:MAG: hypothetical protein NVS3B10_25100 [Polyangiales bacterium]